MPPWAREKAGEDVIRFMQITRNNCSSASMVRSVALASSGSSIIFASLNLLTFMFKYCNKIQSDDYLLYNKPIC